MMDRVKKWLNGLVRKLIVANYELYPSSFLCSLLP